MFVRGESTRCARGTWSHGGVLHQADCTEGYFCGGPIIHGTARTWPLNWLTLQHNRSIQNTTNIGVSPGTPLALYQRVEIATARTWGPGLKAPDYLKYAYIDSYV